MSQKYQPVGNTILVEPVMPNTTLQLPGTIEADTHTIIALGDGSKINKKLKVGDTIILTGYSAVPIRDTKYKLVSAENVLCRVA